jgi:diguanylate cyclase (GGDEF)-like protein
VDWDVTRGPFEDGLPLYFAFSIVLSLIFVLVSRFDPASSLRAWSHAFIAQVLSGGALMAYGVTGRSGALAFCFFFAMANSVLLLDAAETFRNTRHSRSTFGLLVIAGVAAAGAHFTRDPPSGIVLTFAFRAAVLFMAAWLLWRTSFARLVGSRISSYTIVLQGLLNLAGVIGFIYFSRLRTPFPHLELLPFAFLLLDVALALGLVLATTERAREALAFANTELEAARSQLETLADTDPLTGCYNRRVFRALVDRKKHEGVGAGAVFLIDIDGLKIVNDSQGHPAGDALIRQIAEAVKQRVRADELVIRWGGDEFLVVLDRLPPQEVETRKRDLAEAIADAGFGASIGAATFGTECSLLDAVEIADREMYVDKKGRKAARTA